MNSASIIMSPHWSAPFEVMCDASGLDLGSVLGQQKDPSSYLLCFQDKKSCSKELHRDRIRVVSSGFWLWEVYVLFD